MGVTSPDLIALEKEGKEERPRETLPGSRLITVDGMVRAPVQHDRGKRHFDAEG
jgi:hypothetical protein